MEFQIPETVKTISIKDSTGKEVKSFSVDVGNYEYLEKWSMEAERMTKMVKDYTNSPTLETLEGARGAMESVISAVVGTEGWEWLWSFTNHSISVCGAFARKLSDFVIKEMGEISKNYV